MRTSWFSSLVLQGSRLFFRGGKIDVLWFPECVRNENGIGGLKLHVVVVVLQTSAIVEGVCRLFGCECVLVLVNVPLV